MHRCARHHVLSAGVAIPRINCESEKQIKSAPDASLLDFREQQVTMEGARHAGIDTAKTRCSLTRECARHHVLSAGGAIAQIDCVSEKKTNQHRTQSTVGFREQPVHHGGSRHAGTVTKTTRCSRIRQRAVHRCPHYAVLNTGGTIPRNNCAAEEKIESPPDAIDGGSVPWRVHTRGQTAPSRKKRGVL